MNLSLPRGRRARPAPTLVNVLKTLGQASAMWLIFFLVGPYSLYAFEEATSLAPFRWPELPILGALLFAGGGIIALWSAWTIATLGAGTPWPFDSTRHLVIAGPYSYVRNPMAMGSLTQGAGIALGLGSPVVMLYVLAGAVAWQLIARPWEERGLLTQFGEPYERYRDAVRCWIPHSTPYAISHATKVADR